MAKKIQYALTQKQYRRSAWLAFWVLLISGCTTTQRQPTSLGEKLRVPAGFIVETLTTEVPNARAMAEGRRCTIFVGSYAAGNVYALTLRQGRVSEARTLLKGLASPTSIAFRDDSLFVATTTRVFRYDNIEDRAGPVC